MSEALLLLEAEAEVLEMTEPSSEERLEVTMLDTADTLALELQTEVNTKVRNYGEVPFPGWKLLLALG